MIKVILVDDEKWSLYGLMHLIPWEKYQCEIVATATDGADALEACRRFGPDLLITDICMPDISGLDLARALLAEKKKTAIVFITGHEEIKYAQEAIRLGVFDYLLKPIAARDLTDLIEKYTRHIQARQMQPADQLFFTLFDEGNRDTIAESMARLSIPLDKDEGVCVVTMRYQREAENDGKTVIDLSYGRAVLFRTGCYQRTCFVVTGEEMTPDRMKELYAAVGGERPLYAGCSLQLRADAEFYSAFCQSTLALQTADFWKQQEIRSYQEAVDTARIDLARKKMRDMLKANGKDDECIRERLDSLRNMQLDILEKQINEGLWLCHRYRADAHDADEDFKFSLDEFDDFRQIEEYFLNSGDQQAESLNAEQMIRKVLSYIDAHFNEKISLTMIAKKFYINPCYLSTLIHDYTGKTYSEIMTGKRMELVKNLLVDTQLPVTEIAEKAGYNVYSHFLNLFKRETGLPPSAWRARHKGNGEK